MRFFQLNKSYSYVLITLLCLIFLGASYFFIYLPKNETIIEAQRFRTLQNIDNNIHAKIDNSLSLVKTILRLYDKDSKNYLEKYIADYPRENFTLLLDTTSPNNKKDTSKSVSTIVVDDATKEITLLSDKQIITSLNNKTIQGSIKFSFKQFIEFLLPNAVFDEYVIFSKNNTVYESFPTGIGSVKEDSLLNTNNGIGGSYARDITVGGKDYKLFLQPVTFNNESKWILGGMLLKSRYQKERSELPVGIVMLLVTLLLAMIVIFPWIKLHQMGSKDRLTLLDGASSVLVSMLLMSILFFCFFKYNISIKNGDNPKDKKILTSSISNAFYSEIRKMYHILKTCDSLRVGHTGERDIINLNQSDIKFTSNTLNKTNKNEIPVDDSTKNKLSILMRNCIIDQIFWLDSSGSEKYNWISEKLNPPPGDFKVRKYFENINRNKAYYLDGDAVKKFYLDQVVSWNSGTFTSIVSIPSVYPSNYVGAISFTMRSLQDVVLPTGYTFAIIDNDGKVLYHSLSSRNLNENLKSEFTDSLDVSSCINARTEGDFNTQYYSKSYAVHIAPINNLPYFIAIFSDNSYKDAKDIETYSFTFSMLLLFFSFIALLLCTTLLVSSRRSFFKKQLFDTSWIGPRATCHKAYIQSAVINMLMIITLIGFFQKTTFLQYLFLLLFAVTFIFLFQNKLFAERYKKEKRINNHKFKTFAVWLLTVILFIIDVAAYNLLDGGHLLFLLTMELTAILFGWIFINYGDKFSHYYTKNISKKLPQNIEDFLTAEKNYIKSFTLMALTSLIITSGIPVAFFYITSYNYEQNLGIRQRQTDYANRLLNLPSFKIDASSNKVIIKDSIGIYCDGSYISNFPSIVDYQNINKQYEAKENNITRKILENFHLAIGDKSINTNKLYIPYASDTSVIYQPLGISANADSTLFTYKKTSDPNKYIKLKSTNLNYKLPHFFEHGFFLYWLLLITALVIFYNIIINILKKLFCLNLPDLKIWKQMDEKLIANNKLNHLLFVIGLPGSGKLNYIKKKIENKEIEFIYKNGQKELIVLDPKNRDKNNVFIADLINIPDTGPNIENNVQWQKFCADSLDDKNRLVLINHFEYNIQDEYSNQAKLNFLEQLLLKNTSKIIILSTIHPISFLDSINEAAKKLFEVNKKTDTDKTVDLKPSHDLERWNVLLGHYRIALIPITNENIENEDLPSWKKLLSRETSYTHFLHDMQACTFDIIEPFVDKKTNEIKDKKTSEMIVRTDELAYKLQVSAHYFYMYIWQSLTKEEKFLLYDLAEDNLVNSYDNYNLTMLFAKGVILNNNGALQFFNKGFRNFILTAIGNTEAMKIKDRINENGNWNKLKTPLVLAILAILAFLLISQQEAYSKLITYVAALSAGVPAVLKIFSLFDKNATKANT